MVDCCDLRSEIWIVDLRTGNLSIHSAQRLSEKRVNRISIVVNARSSAHEMNPNEFED